MTTAGDVYEEIIYPTWEMDTSVYWYQFPYPSWWRRVYFRIMGARTRKWLLATS